MISSSVDSRLTKRAREKQPLIRAAIYTRKSVARKDEDDFTSCKAQRQYCEAFIEKQEGWSAGSQEYSDYGFSGASLNRPAFQRLISDLKAGLFDAVVVYKLSRISRSIADFASFMSLLKRLGVSLISITENIDDTTAAGRFSQNVHITVNEYQREVIAEMTRDKICAARRQGRWTGGHLPFGFDLENKKLIINRIEARIVGMIFNLFNQRHSLLPVVKELERRHLKTKRGNPFTRASLLRLLKNPVYAGKIGLAGELFPGMHEPIIDEVVFERAQEILRQNQRGAVSKNRTKAYLLKGLLYCGHCGAAMLGNSSKKGDRSYFYYRCAAKHANGHECCPTPPIPADAIESFILGRIKNIGKSSVLIEETLKKVREALESQVGELRVEEKRHQTEIRRCRREVKGLLSALAKANGGGASIAHKIADLETEIEGIDNRLSVLDGEIQALETKRIDEAGLRKSLSVFDEVWDVLFPAEQRRVLQLLIHQITLGFNRSDRPLGSLRIAYRPLGWRLLAGELEEENEKPREQTDISEPPTFTVEYQVRLQRGPRGRKVLVLGTAAKKPAQATKLSSTARLLARAHYFDQLLRCGEVKNMAELARRAGISRARVSQVMRLLFLSPRSQEEILCEKSKRTERMLRGIRKDWSWEKQEAYLGI